MLCIGIFSQCSIYSTLVQYTGSPCKKLLARTYKHTRTSTFITHAQRIGNTAPNTHTNTHTHTHSHTDRETMHARVLNSISVPQPRRGHPPVALLWRSAPLLLPSAVHRAFSLRLCAPHSAHRMQTHTHTVTVTVTVAVTVT